MSRQRGVLLTELPELKDGLSPLYGTIDSNGRVHVLCSEGVGWTITDKPFTTDFAGDWTMQQIADLLTDGSERKVIDLADFIREFGFRLENNFHLWYAQLAGWMDTMGERDLSSIASSLASIADSYQPSQALADIADACESMAATLITIDAHLIVLVDSVRGESNG